LNFFARHKRAFFIAAAVLCAAMMALSAAFRERPTLIEDALAFAVTPAQKFLTGAGGWVKERIAFLSLLNEIAAENSRLSEKNAELEVEIARLTLIERENARLNELLALSQRYPEYEIEGAGIIANDPGNWYANFTIDKGRRDGFEKNMVILAPGGLVGRIYETGINYSKVRALIDDTNAVSAKSARTGDVGVVKGDMKLSSEGLCRMELIDIDAEIAVGDEIVTSNLGDIYPPGLTIGHVSEINADAGGLTKYAIIKPAVDFKHLETVLVINREFIREFVDQEQTEDTTGDEGS